MLKEEWGDGDDSQMRHTVTVAVLFAAYIFYYIATLSPKLQSRGV